MVWTFVPNNLNIKLWPCNVYWQTFLQDRLTGLKDLILSEDGLSQDLQTLIDIVLGKIESWLNWGEGIMKLEAQSTLSNMGYNGPTKNNICNQFSCKVEQMYYLNLSGFTTWIRTKNVYLPAISLYSEVRPAIMLFQTKNGERFRIYFSNFINLPSLSRDPKMRWRTKFITMTSICFTRFVTAVSPTLWNW